MGGGSKNQSPKTHQSLFMSLAANCAATCRTKSHCILYLQHNTCVLRSIFNILSGFTHCVWHRDCSDTAMQKRKMHLGYGQFHYTESSCFSSGSRLLCRLPSAEKWKHGTNNIMCYSNFALGLVICPSAVTSVADRADVPVRLPVFPRLHSL